jgi:hypothetical protein
MPSEQVRKFVERTHTHLNHNIKLADQKASILLTGNIAFLALYSNFIELNWGSGSFIFKIVSVLTICVGLAGIALAGWTVYPRTPQETGSLMYWGAIHMRSFDEYQNECQNLNEELLFDEMINENYNLALVAAKKFHHFRMALLFTGIMIILAIMSGLGLIG